MTTSPQDRSRDTGPDTGVAHQDAQPGGANTPQGAPGERPTPSVADRAEPGAPPPGTNQPKNEPVPASPSRPERESTAGSAHPQGPDARSVAAAGSSSRVPGEQGQPPRDIDTDDRAGAARTHPGSPPASVGPSVPSPGDARGASVPGVEAARGTSEESEAVSGVKTTATAPPGKPDGEVDTRA